MRTMARPGGSLMEVARLCSVSQSTVSRVLNNSNHGRFSVDDGRHEFVAALHGHSECFVAWVECRS